VGEVRRASAPAPSFLAATELQVFAQVQPARGLRQRITPDEVGAELGQLALVRSS
jgi:hypothetical protein